MKLRILLAFLLLLFIPGLCRAEPAATTSPSEFDQLRAQRPVIRDYYQSLMVRNLAANIASAMHDKGFTDDQIREVLEGSSFAGFAGRVVRDPRVEKSLDGFLNRLLAPGALEAMMQKKSLELAARRQAALALAVEELVRAQKQLVLSQETPKEPPTLWQRILRYMTKDLF